jgi:hypothetical protein
VLGPPVTCSPASGSSFPVGTTTVTSHQHAKLQLHSDSHYRCSVRDYLS